MRYQEARDGNKIPNIHTTWTNTRSSWNADIRRDKNPKLTNFRPRPSLMREQREPFSFSQRCWWKLVLVEAIRSKEQQCLIPLFSSSKFVLCFPGDTWGGEAFVVVLFCVLRCLALEAENVNRPAYKIKQKTWKHERQTLKSSTKLGLPVIAVGKTPVSCVTLMDPSNHSFFFRIRSLYLFAVNSFNLFSCPNSVMLGYKMCLKPFKTNINVHQFRTQHPKTVIFWKIPESIRMFHREKLKIHVVNI